MKILVIQGNPEKESFNGELASAYARGAISAGHDVHRIDLGDLKFDPILTRKLRTISLEEDIADARKRILWCQKLVVIYPVWWGIWPALLKGFIDRTLESGFAYKYHENDPFWDKLLAGRRGHIISTFDAPALWIWWQYGNADIRAMKNATLEFCGVRPVEVTRIARVRFLKPDERQKWIQKVEGIAAQP